MRLLIVTAVDAEAGAIGAIEHAHVIVSGIGRTNAAAATTQAILDEGPFDAVLSAGVAGSLPGSGLEIGDVIVARLCVYAEEGLIIESGFEGMRGLGLSLGDFEGNAVPVDEHLRGLLKGMFRTGPIATVATCSGTDAAAEAVVARTGALAEAMEGAAVVHAARRLQIPGIELRAISNTTGRRDMQRWDLKKGLSELGQAVQRAVVTLHESIR